MTQVNLLPPELRAREVTRRQTSLVVVAGVIVIALVGLFYFFQVMNLSRAQDDLAAQEADNAQLQAQIDDLQRFADLRAQLAARQALIRTVFAGEISWFSALLDVSRVIPTNAYLTSLSASISAAPAEGAPGGAALVGTIAFTGQLLETDTLASWLTRLEQVDGWVNAWFNSATESGPFTRIYTFSSGLDLTAEATTRRGSGVQP